MAAFLHMSCMKEIQNFLFPIGTPSTLKPVVTSIGSPLHVEYFSIIFLRS